MFRKFLALFVRPRAVQLEALTSADKEQYEPLCYTNEGVQVFVKMKVYTS